MTTDVATPAGGLTPLHEALRLLDMGLWPVAIAPPDAPRSKFKNPGKQPMNLDGGPLKWGIEKPTRERLIAVYKANPGAGVGIRLGPPSDVIDVEVDDPVFGPATLDAILGGELVETMGWNARRGGHLLFEWEDRFRELAAVVEGDKRFPGLSLRIGKPGDVDPNFQCQSVVPPTAMTVDDGKTVQVGLPREWNGVGTIAKLPEYAFQEIKRRLALPKGGKDRPPAIAAQIPAHPDGRDQDLSIVAERCIKYLRACPPAVSGSGGHNQTFKVACNAGPGFGLPEEVFLPIFMAEYGNSCKPPWSEREARHKVEDAYKEAAKKGRWNWLRDQDRPGYAARSSRAIAGSIRSTKNDREPPPGEVDVAGGEPDPQPNEGPDDPHRLARLYRDSRGIHPEGMKIRLWREEWTRWERGRYRTVPEKELKADINLVIKGEFDTINLKALELHRGRQAKGGGAAEKAAQEGSPWVRKVTTTIVGNTTAALAAYTTLNSDVPQPSWLDPREGDWDPIEVLAARNALIHLPSLGEPGRIAIIEPTPRFFSPYALDLDFDLSSPPPLEWLKFLDQLWPDDPDSVATLQEWAGYLLTGDTSLQKILLVIGPKRSGKGTITRILTDLVGPDNVANPTLGSLGTEFGLSPLIGKLAAFIADARLSGRMDAPAIGERLLSISGEDGQTINRKHLSQVTARIPTRFMLMSNELPKLNDSSGALSGRFVTLELRHSFYGREDRALTARLRKELPGILLWAIAGWKRLRQRGHFVQPESGQELMAQLEDFASPVGAFLRERCEIAPGKECITNRIYDAWKEYCTEKGRKEAGDEATFGRNLRAANPFISRSGPVHRSGYPKRVRVYSGVDLCDESDS